MKKRLTIIIGGGALAISVAVAGMSFAEADTPRNIHGTIPVANQAEAEYPGMAKITLNQALQNAVKAAPGRVLKAELENESGFLIYDIEVVGADKTTMDVTLDAGSGQVLALRKDKADQHDHESEDNESDEHDDHEGDE